MHETLILNINECCDRLIQRADQLKRHMISSYQLAENDPGILHYLKAESRGAAIVGICAELEALTRSILQNTHRELNTLRIPFRVLNPSLRQLAAHQIFESLKSLNDHAKLWEKRAAATTLDGCLDPLTLPVETRLAQPPLDGRTLRPEHFYRIWDIYDLPGDAFPTVSWAASLQKLAMLRNDIAHGNIPFREVFQQAGISQPEVEKYLDDISCFATYLSITWIDYLANQGYRIKQQQ
ncbi:HEPN domain-containing protein [Nocardia wallacei]|uniref:HEPN domain-containing protein n=1 Tax=Nocardia wallacei TaxID=480035 RepID=UPI002456417D|nr:HEPN domain-containing protein [Nocardia wallacei]